MHCRPVSFMKHLLGPARLALFAGLLSASAYAGAFTPGNIVVSRIGSGTGSSNGAPLFLDEYTPNGSLVQSIALPTSGSGANASLVVQGSATTEGYVTRSGDGAFLAVAGYAGSVGATSSTLSGASASSTNRVAALIDANGNIDTTTRLSSGSGAIRSAVTQDGNRFWFTGANDGVHTVPFGNAAGSASTIVNSAGTNLRVGGIFGSQLYFSTASGTPGIGFWKVGNGLPTTSGNAVTQIIGTTNSHTSAFILLDLDAGVAGVDTAYVTIGSSIAKYKSNGSTWTAAGSIATSASALGVTALVNGSSVTVFATTVANVLRATDTASGTLSGSFSTLATAGSGQAFRGVVEAPQGGGSTTSNPTGSGTATPNTVNIGEQTLLRVVVTPGSDPVSTGITVTGNLSAIGGSTSQAFFDNGTNGDATAGDNIFSYATTVSSGTGAVSIPVTVADAESRSSATSIGLSISSPTGITFIHSIQTPTNTPLSGSYKVEGIVTGVFSGLGGFTVQEEAADYDADPLTSEGIFVESTASVQVGQKVQVQGTISNEFNLTRFDSGATVTVQAGGATFPLPAAMVPVFPFAAGSTHYLERFEGMRVSFPGRLYVTDHYNLERYGELLLSPLTQIFQPTEVVDPNNATASGVSSSGTSNVAAVTARQSLNDRYRVMLDNGNNIENGSPIPFLRTSAIGGGKTLRLGDYTQDLAGVLFFDFSEWRVQVPGGPASVTFSEGNARPATAPLVGGNVKVAGSNVLNYFTTLNSRGANTTTEFNRQKAKIVAGLKGINAAVVALSELQNNGTGSNSAVYDLVKSATGLNTAMTQSGLPTYEIVTTPSTPFGSDEIQCGFIYQPSLVTPVVSGLPNASSTGAVTDNAAFSTYSRPPLAQLFSVNATGGKFWVIANHFKSKGAGDATGADLDQGDGQSAYNFRRKNQATALINFINNTLSPIDPDVLVIGDLNAYGEEDPIDLFRAAGLIDLVTAFSPTAQPYSYLFDGQIGRLDHGLATPSLAAQVTGAVEWHVNADEPRAIDYDLTYKTDDQFVANLYRYADHDPIIVGLDIPAAALQLTPEYGRSGSVITIIGGGLGSTSSVQFAGGATASFTITSSSKLTVTVPATAQTGPIQVTTGSGVLTTSPFRLLPKVNSFTPASGSVGVEVTVIGSGFSAATDVKFGATDATFVVDSDTQLRAVVPVGAVRSNIRVEAPGGSATSVARFNVTQ